MDNETLTLYWSPGLPFNLDTSPDYNGAYFEPHSLHSEFVTNSEKDTPAGIRFTSCPAVNAYSKNTFVFTNPLSYELLVNKDYVSPKNPNKPFINAEYRRPPTLKDSPIVSIGMSWFIFSEEPVIARFTPPYFHEPKYTQHGTVVSGGFDVGSWFRPFNLDIQMWKNKTELILEEGEPLFYVHIETEKKVILKRFVYNKTLGDIALSCAQSPTLFGKHLPLEKRYNRFIKSKTHSKVLKEIKNNLI
jgi:hypothetical protein